MSALTIEGLAKSLGVARAGFYWHFKNRDDLLRQLLSHWTHELTEVVTENPDLHALEPKSRLIKAVEMVRDYELARYEMAIRQWAMREKGAALHSALDQPPAGVRYRWRLRPGLRAGRMRWQPHERTM